jgi:hypothetical protein
VALGSTDLGKACRAAVAEGIWLFYGLLLDPEPRIRRWALLTIEATDRNRDRALRTIRHLARHDPDEAVRKSAQSALRDAS